MTFEPRGLRPYIPGMRRLPVLALAALFALPAAAQEEEGKSLMEQGIELFFEGLREEMEPTLDEFLGLTEEFGPSMRSFFQEMGPALAELVEQVQDWSAYHPPEILPNGDIILRRKQPPEAPEPPDADDGGGGTIDL